MNWHRIKGNWKQLKEKSVFHWERLRRDDRDCVHLIRSAPSKDQGSNPQTTTLHPDDHVRRSEFSLHIGC
jgi:hypothetical protein